MDTKALTPILLAVLLACTAFYPAKCEGGEETKMVGSSKLYIELCIKDTCDPGNKRCYCCKTIPNEPCYWNQQECWNACPNRQQLHVGSLPPALAPSSIIDEQHYRSINSRAVPESTSPGDNL